MSSKTKTARLLSGSMNRELISRSLTSSPFKKLLCDKFACFIKSLLNLCLALSNNAVPWKYENPIAVELARIQHALRQQRLSWV